MRRQSRSGENPSAGAGILSRLGEWADTLVTPAPILVVAEDMSVLAQAKPLPAQGQGASVTSTGAASPALARAHPSDDSVHGAAADALPFRPTSPTAGLASLKEGNDATAANCAAAASDALAVKDAVAADATALPAIADPADRTGLKDDQELARASLLNELAASSPPAPVSTERPAGTSTALLYEGLATGAAPVRGSPQPPARQHAAAPPSAHTEAAQPAGPRNGSAASAATHHVQLHAAPTDHMAGWRTVHDPATNAYYYYNTISGQSSWTWPPTSAYSAGSSMPAPAAPTITTNNNTNTFPVPVRSGSVHSGPSAARNGAIADALEMEAVGGALYVHRSADRASLADEPKPDASSATAMAATPSSPPQAAATVAGLASASTGPPAPPPDAPPASVQATTLCGAAEATPSPRAAETAMEAAPSPAPAPGDACALVTPSPGNLTGKHNTAASPLPLRDQVHAAVSEYAIAQGQLAAICAAARVPYDDAGARKIVEMAARQIGTSVEARGETAYSLRLDNGQPNAVRISAVHRYLQKIITRRGRKQ